MHNKFAIFDGRDTIPENSWVWTGSYSLTYNGTFKNSNDVIEIQDDSLALAFTDEFNEMLGDTGDISPDTGHFSRSKNTDPSWHFIINGDTCDLYFSPSPMPEPEESSQVAILNAVKTADHSIYFCIYIFTRQPLCDTMKKKWESGDTVRGVFDRGWWNYHYMYTCSKSYDMRGDSVLYNDSLITNPWTPTAYVYADSVESNGKLHHKYMIIDAEYPNSDPIVITGSQNWSKSGCYSNDENILIIHSPFVANQYLQHFVARYTEAGGVFPGVEEISFANRKAKLETYPNPFTTKTVIEFNSHLPNSLTPQLKIYDLAGRLVKIFPITNHQLPITRVVWDGRDAFNKKVRAGVYFIKLKHDEGHSEVKKVVKL